MSTLAEVAQAVRAVADQLPSEAIEVAASCLEDSAAMVAATAEGSWTEEPAQIAALFASALDRIDEVRQLLAELSKRLHEIAPRARLAGLTGRWLAEPTRGGITGYLTGHHAARAVGESVLHNSLRVILHAGYESASRLLGSALLACLDTPGSLDTLADRDPDVFPEPNVLRLDRRPNPHVAFGRGPHTCPGSWLAALLVRTVLTALARDYPRVRQVSELVVRPNVTLRGLQRLDLSLC
ncbi:hypothetical protein [Streptoalloteichus tenebrarius]|uniref:hypothetical protein n=1 Tax=Streptoalloteichus tenebrarius (strain ATCC 17920 / DSM 40477 / JCM 4838 / CBS 697.72 / NBRC 16177 / NCIMB 11028 / NRRL B-12390 / A12253. 1 / ISP 5477) TaxID=1933 RepID=UPI0035E8E246|nr:hypothetical protein GCM10020241_08410 [Streptoalloteichus tenebrarius]